MMIRIRTLSESIDFTADKAQDDVLDFFDDASKPSVAGRYIEFGLFESLRFSHSALMQMFRHEYHCHCLDKPAVGSPAPVCTKGGSYFLVTMSQFVA